MSAVNILVEETVETVTISVTNGADGEAGAAATVAVGATTTGEAGTNASVTETGTAQNKTFDFVIPRGADGAAGADGEAGAAAIVAVGATTTGEAGTNASVTETGDAQNKTFDFVIPRGADGAAGADGEAGAAATVAVGTTTTGEAGTNASVTETGDAQNKTFNFVIPRGADGAAGADGEAGAAATVSVGTTTTGEAGTNASVTETGDAQNKTFNFVIPRGADGGGGGGGKFVDGTNPDDAVYLAGRVGVGVALPVARQHIQGNDAAVVVQRVQGAAGQTANLAEWRNAGGKTLMEVSAEGELTFSGNNDLLRPTASIYVAADILDVAVNALYITGGGLFARIYIGAPNDRQILNLTNVLRVDNAPVYITGNFALGGINNSHGISRVGNDVAIWTSFSNGRLLHYTNPASSGARGVLRYVVLPNGNFGIGVEEPTEKLHVDGKIKATSINFSGLPTSVTGLETGDVWNDNGTLKIV
jgi:hypothetical protein